ncbi:TonB-dependent receptor plug domain-containing protein [Paucibacter sp. R3-3]|uniref:TonB-dependent receptor plug domain-containing protein n=1 Tax=Roseateles agri TaxID=3098619 RepID=A0ABU5DA98_9BURK|nr:TonB-dependent receptor [Paucibacter sp. R3-3]MDY0743158.1 TonB-dependent receptor plug domain-containing protein [Paucibacter sp. R3-3]
MSRSVPSAPSPRIALHIACLSLSSAAALAQANEQGAADPADSPSFVAAVSQLDTVEIEGRHYDNSIGSSDAASQGVIRAELLKSRPALRPGEVLEFVPGLIVTQHSGDGKANQYFLRGFNLDHGTDFATTVGGLPVNMPTHGHGQGYSDLNFLMPELVDKIEYRKGPYFAKNGDFASAGSADITYRTRLDAPFAALTLGENGYRRGIAAGSTELGGGLTLLGAIELMRNDGPWTVPEGLHKSNGVLTLSGGTAASGWSASLMGYSAHWTSTDQIPERLADAGTYQGKPFGRFDSADPSDGGETHRTSLSGEWHDSSDSGSTRFAAYVIDYQLKLFSNFTYALERPDTGDQFSQQDKRQVYGFSASRTVDHSIGSLPARSEVGIQLRQDHIRVGLFDTEQRQIIGTTRNDKVNEGLYGLYAQTAVELTPWLRSVVGLRADAANFSVDSLSNAANSGHSRDHRVSPKFSLIAGPWAKTEFFFNAGRGFHSNDARGTTATVDPKTGDAVDKVPGLVASRGMELGARTEWIPGLQSSLALWKLDFDSELVYVGDAGATEPNRPSTRRGIEWNNRWIPIPWLLVDADLAWTHARFSDDDPAGNRIPNAVDKVGSVAVTVRDLGPWSASIQWRYLGSGALIEDNSVRSHSSLTTNLRISRKLGRWFGRDAELTMDVFNLLDRKLNDIEYYYESQLPGESAPVADRHIHPAEPRAVRVTLKTSF